MLRTPLVAFTFVFMAGCSAETAMLQGPPAPVAGLPSFRDAPTTFGTADNPTAFGPATARIEGNAFFIRADNGMSLFSRRISYDPSTRKLSSKHRDLDLVYDDSAGAFVGTVRDPKTRDRRRVSVSVPASALPG